MLQLGYMSERNGSRIRTIIESGVKSTLIEGRPADRIRLVEEGTKLLLRYSREIENIDQKFENPDLRRNATTRRETNVGHLMRLRARLRASLIEELEPPHPKTRRGLGRIIT